MDRRDEAARALREQGLAFFGRTTAGQSHEVTNVLNVINELAGLQLDLLQAAAAGATPRLERLAELADKIQQQVHRGETIVRFVNRFAHSVDLDVAVFDLKELLGMVLFLAGRPARLSRTGLEAELPDETIVIENNPFCVQQAVSVLIDLALRSAADHRRVTVSYRLREGGAEVAVASDDPVVGPDPRLLELAALLAEETGATLTADPDASGELHRFVLLLPRHRDPGDDAGAPSPARSRGETDGT